MTTDDSHQIEDEFIKAKNNWELEKLYVDLASAKGKALTPIEKKFLRGLLCGCSPAEIAKIVYQSGSSSTVRVYLSNGLYKYIEEMLSNQVGYSVKVKNWSRVTHLLEKAGYKKGWFKIQPVVNPLKINTERENDSLENGAEAINVSIFHGRTQELAQVRQWIVQERCRLVVILGMGGIGKTAFSAKLAETIKDEFEYVIWRSLRFAPPLEVLLHQLIQLLSPTLNTTSLQTVESRIVQLIECLRTRQCLIVLDHVDSIFANGDRYETQEYAPMPNNSQGIKNGYAGLISQIRYRPGYEGYGELIRRLGDWQHQSCVVLTAREKPPEIAALEGETLPIRSLKLTGLDQEASIAILRAKGLDNQTPQKECEILFKRYASNPLFIKLVATTIQELFGGNISELIAQGTWVFGDIRAMLDQHFHRLSDIEKYVMYWLALNPDLVSLRKLQTDITIPGVSPQMSPRLILEAIELLHRRSLIEKATPTTSIEKQAIGFSLIPVLKEYLIEQLIEKNFKLSQQTDSYLFINHTNFAVQLKNYMRENQLNTQM
ncbi:MAG: NB-ARC domain-containing protein [Mojavia pulchra JT2-VF2]|jgi:hypothetical protein|uniref:NB-ARC domain-containing protein n=1 Tax=Mojavia pulchra JT2-VF2 TaxID=287848 RepID=A0A951UF39_9NOST|nr:NB-ARC domain-containing protein [Mojavia pulchra JT2-VF2]